MNVLYPNKLRGQFFLYGKIPIPSLRTFLGHIIDAEKHDLRQHSAQVSPLEREMIAEIVGVTLALRNDVYAQEHPDFVSSYADLVHRLNGLQKNHPFYVRGSAAMDEYLGFLLTMTRSNHMLIERYASGMAGKVGLTFAAQSEFSVGSLRHI